MKHFTTNWFKGREPYFTQYLDHFRQAPKLVFLEIGCWEGQCTCWLADNFPQAEIHVIDPFTGNPEHKEATGYDLNGLQQRFDENVAEYGSRIVKHVATSREVLPDMHKLDGVYNKPFELIYIDGSHVSDDVAFDATYSWSLLKFGGIMIFDDYTWRQDYPPDQTPKLAIDVFLDLYEGQYRLLHKKACVIIQKI